MKKHFGWSSHFYAASWVSSYWDVAVEGSCFRGNGVSWAVLPCLNTWHDGVSHGKLNCSTTVKESSRMTCSHVVMQEALVLLSKGSLSLVCQPCSCHYHCNRRNCRGDCIATSTYASPTQQRNCDTWRKAYLR